MRRALVFLLCAGTTLAGEPKPVPRMQAVPQPHHEVSFQREGTEIARYFFGDGNERPFVFPIIGPSGRSLTRMGHPRDHETHSHHNSVWLSHQSVNATNFWEDRGGRIVHVKVLRFEDRGDESFIESENVWQDKDGKPLLRELRRTAVRLLPHDEWWLTIDTQLEARDAEVVLGQTAFGMIGVRMAKTIGVNDGGGTIRNSAGGIDEAGCFRKPARWCDYSGPIAPNVVEGITLMDHPMNLNHPVPFHVRNDGWMGASLTFAAPHTITPGEPLRLRYGLYVHAAMPPMGAIEARWEEFAKSPFAEFSSKK